MNKDALALPWRNSQSNQRASHQVIRHSLVKPQGDGLLETEMSEWERERGAGHLNNNAYYSLIISEVEYSVTTSSNYLWHTRPGLFQQYKSPRFPLNFLNFFTCIFLAAKKLSQIGTFVPTNRYIYKQINKYYYCVHYLSVLFLYYVHYKTYTKIDKRHTLIFPSWTVEVYLICSPSEISALAKGFSK